MKILLIGNTGQLGWELERCLAPFGAGKDQSIAAVDYPELDLSDPGSIVKVVKQYQPSLIVNAAAYTQVDQAESESRLAFDINAKGVGILGEQAKRTGAALIHFSTDYVFDGAKKEPYLESDQPNPINEYGKSKLAGEQCVKQIESSYLIFRTAWVYSLHHDSFVTKVLRWSRNQKSLKIVADQVSNPTWARMLAQVVSLVIAMGHKDIYGWMNEYKGLYHLAGDGFASRYDWGEAILNFDPARSEQSVAEVSPAFTLDFQSPAQRPLFSALNCELFKQTFGIALPGWRVSLRQAMSG